MNLIAMLIHLAWFSSGFVPGYLIAQRHGPVLGALIGFFIYLMVLFLVNRLILAVGNRPKDR